MLDNFAPARQVLVGVNVDHDELAKWAMRSYVDYNPIPLKERSTPAPKYTGGYDYVKSENTDSTVAIAFEMPGGWSSSNNVALAVYEAVLGGCLAGEETTSGTYLSKLTQGIVAPNKEVGSCTAFSHIYSDSGLWGVSGSVAPSFVPTYIEKVAAALAAPVSAEELTRAKTALKKMASMSVDKSGDCADDIAKQMFMSGGKGVLSAEEIGGLIDKVSASQIEAVQGLVRTSKPTVVVYGDTAYAPEYDSLCATLAGPKLPAGGAAKK
jgi:processing peptidase subunit alpha